MQTIITRPRCHPFHRFRVLALTTALAASCFAPSVAFASDDAEDRYHDAYALEVVDGKTADAARLYLALIADEDAPASIRAESRFRFAVCSVLLGRADEARRLLTELAADESIASPIRARAREYVAAIADVGVGSEVDKKLQDMVFDLGRTSISEFAPPVYRDFAILGETARPLLRELLSHSDVRLRQHAMRLLCRMDEPDMMSRWTREIGLGARHPRWEIRDYIDRHPEQRPVLVKKLLALDDKALGTVLNSPNDPIGLGEEFVRALLGRELDPGAMLLFVRGQYGVQRYAVLEEWSRSDDSVLARGAAVQMLEIARSGVPEGEPGPGSVLALTKATIDVDGAYDPNQVTTWCGGLKELAKLASSDELFEALEFVLERSRDRSEPSQMSPARRGLGRLFADVLVERPAGEVDGPRLAAALIDMIGILGDEERARYPARGPEGYPPWSGDLGSLRKVLEQLPEADAVAAIDALFEGPAKSYPRHFLAVLPMTRESLVPRAMELLAEFTPVERLRAMNDLLAVDYSRAQHDRWRPVIGTAEVISLSIPELASTAYPDSESWGENTARSLLVLDEETARERLVATWTAATARTPRVHSSLPQNLILGLIDPQRPTAGARIVIPVLERLHRSAPNAMHRSSLVDLIVHQVQRDVRSGVTIDADREALRAFVRAHYSDIRHAWKQLLEHRDLFPVRDWAHAAPSNVWSPNALGADPGSAELDALVRDVSADASRVNETIVAIVTKLASPEVRDEVLDRFLREVPTDALHPVVNALRARNTKLGSVSAIEAAIARLVADSDSDWRSLSIATRVLVDRQPTERLFPAVRRLLSSAERDAVLAGIGFANSLGRTDLIPDLIAKLDSMDGEVRTKSREAIDSILELERLRKEARESVGGGRTGDDGR